MRNLWIILVAILPVMSCVKPSSTPEQPDAWNGYLDYLKAGEMTHTLWAGRNINVGVVIYGIDENANFYVTYDCSSSGWKISETHMFAGDKLAMPLNKPGAPKIGQFPYSGYHNPRVSTYTYCVPLSQLPPCAAPGFVVASHCVVHSPSGRCETAWAEGDYTFSDKGWGWYDDYYYSPPADQFNILYGTTYSLDTMYLYHINLSSNDAILILSEYVGNAPGTWDGAAYDASTGMFFFTNYNTWQLWANQLTGEEPSFCTGTLQGPAASGTFHEGCYYYVNETTNTINSVHFDAEWMIVAETVLDTIPVMVTISDIAMSPYGDYLYMLGYYNGGGTELISWDMSDHEFFVNSTPLSGSTQITFGTDQELYAIESVCDSGCYSEAYIINLDSLVYAEIDFDGVIGIDDPFSDITCGPAQ